MINLQNMAKLFITPFIVYLFQTFSKSITIVPEIAIYEYLLNKQNYITSLRHLLVRTKLILVLEFLGHTNFGSYPVQDESLRGFTFNH